MEHTQNANMRMRTGLLAMLAMLVVMMTVVGCIPTAQNQVQTRGQEIQAAPTQPQAVQKDAALAAQAPGCALAIAELTKETAQPDAETARQIGNWEAWLGLALRAAGVTAQVVGAFL